ncbi:MAG: hypothetical protein KGZ58_13155 [Ignavibacteriales bacterium]|nr:hypothetical protein [Ignavibacteriales bacterium]
MSSLTIHIPADFWKIIESHKEIDWREIAQQSVMEYAKKVALADRLTRQSTLTDEDETEIDVRIKSGLAQKYV